MWYRHPFIFIATFIALVGCDRYHPILINDFKGQRIPHIHIFSLDSLIKVDMTTLSANRSSIYIYFSPHCPYCRAETKELLKNHQELSNINLYFVSNAPYSSLKAYVKEFDLQNVSGFHLLWDDHDEFADYYKIPGYPFFIRFTSDERVVDELLGQASIHQITKDL
jgi:thiol-disulfide isomerase/thioredoxin